MPSHQRNRSSKLSQHSGTSAAIRCGELKISDPIPFDIPLRPNGSPASAGFDALHTVNPSEMQHLQQNTGIGPGEIFTTSHISAGPSIVPSSSLSTATSKSSLKQKNTGGIVASLKRMFGSKRSRLSLPDAKGYDQGPRPKTSATDALVSNLASPGQGPTLDNAEKPIDRRATQAANIGTNSITPASALGSHHPSQVLTAPPESAQINSPKIPPRRRSSTAPALVLSPEEEQILAGPQDELSHREWNRLERGDSQLRRRSRSADVLTSLPFRYEPNQEMAADRALQIDYWRRGIFDNAEPVVPPDRMDTVRAKERSNKDTQKLQPMQSFDFGLTQPGAEPMALEDRVNTLEVKLFDFEYAIAKLQGHDMAKPTLYSKPGSTRPPLNDVFTTGKETMAVPASPPFRGLVPTSSFPSPANEMVDLREAQQSRSPSNGSSQDTTIRPLQTPTRRRRGSLHKSSKGQTSPSLAQISSDKYEALVELIKEEQAVRQRLEMQVADLRRDVEMLRTPVFAEIRPVAIPSPSPRTMTSTTTTTTTGSSRQEITTTFAAPRSLRRSPRFEYQKPMHEELSRFSVSEIDTDTDTGCHRAFDKAQSPPLVGVS